MKRSTIRIGRAGRKSDRVDQPAVTKTTVVGRVVNAVQQQEMVKRSTITIGKVGAPQAPTSSAVAPVTVIGLVKYSADQPRDYHGRFAASTDFNSWDDVHKFFEAHDIKIDDTSLAAINITPQHMGDIAQVIVQSEAKFPGAMDELKSIEGTTRYADGFTIAAVDNMRLYGTGTDTRTASDGSKMLLTENFSKFVNNPDALTETLKENPGVVTATAAEDFITHEMGHVVQNMSSNELGTPWVQQFWSRSDGLMQQGMIAAGWMTKDGRYQGGYKVQNNMIMNDVSDYACTSPSEFHSEVLVLLNDPEKFNALPEDAQQRIRTYQETINKGAGKDLVKLLSNDTMTHPHTTFVDDFGLPPEFWREFHEAIGKPDTVTKDANSGRTQLRDEHGRFTNEAEPQLRLDESVRMISSEIPPAFTYKLKDQIERINKRIYPVGTDVAAERKADIESATREHTLTEWKTPNSGRVRFAYVDWDTTLQRRFVNEVVTLQQKNPSGSDDITVVGPRGFRGGYGLSLGSGVFEFTNDTTMGLTNSDGQVFVNGTITYQKTIEDWNTSTRGGFHPEEMVNVEPWKSVLVHEYGHSLDPGLVDITTTDDGASRSPETKQALADHPSASQYGLSSDYEAYAEAYAQFYLSGGKTTDPLAQALAKTEGWKV